MASKLHDAFKARINEYRKDPRMRQQLKKMCENIEVNQLTYRSNRSSTVKGDSVRLALDSFAKIKAKNLDAKTEDHRPTGFIRLTTNIEDMPDASRLSKKASGLSVKFSETVHTNFFQTINQQIQNYIKKPEPFFQKDLTDYKGMFKDKQNCLSQRSKTNEFYATTHDTKRDKKLYKPPRVLLTKMEQNFNDYFNITKTLQTEYNDPEEPELAPMPEKSHSPRKVINGGGRLTKLPKIGSINVKGSLTDKPKSVLVSLRSMIPLRRSQIKSLVKFSVSFKGMNQTPNQATSQTTRKGTKHRTPKCRSVKEPAKHVEFANKVGKLEVPNFNKEFTKGADLIKDSRNNTDMRPKLTHNDSGLSDVSIDLQTGAREPREVSLRNLKKNVLHHKKIDRLLKNLDDSKACPGCTTGFFSKTQAPYNYGVLHKHYKSYWLDCINRLLDKEKLEDNEQLGYHRLFQQEPTTQHLSSYKYLSVDSFKLDQLLTQDLATVYSLMLKTRRDLQVDHDNFITLK